MTVPRPAVLLIVAVVPLLLPACGNGNGAFQSTSEKSSGSTLRRNFVLTLSEVKEIFRDEPGDGYEPGRYSPGLLLPLFTNVVEGGFRKLRMDGVL